MNCLGEERLLELHMGDGTDEDRRHAAGCVDCGTRLRTLRRDLGRIDTVLAETPPRRVTSHGRLWRLAPLAVGAVLALAVMLPRVQQVPVGSADDDTLALADEVADALALDAQPTDSPGESTCVWGDPLLGVGCDEPDAMQIAWR
jgi:hypothetical protein